MRSKIALVLAAFAIAVFALELGLRVYLSAFGDERQKVLYLYSRQEINALKSRYRGLAFLNYGLSTLRDDVNALGYRGPEVALPKPEGAYRIVALGGSTTFGTYLESWERAYPHQLQLALRRHGGYDHVEVINAGVPGYTSWESAANLLFRIPDLAPDLVIIYHGINDLNPRLGGPDYYDGLNSGKGIWIEHDEPAPASVLYRYIASKLGWELKVAYSLGELFQQPADYRACGLAMASPPICRSLGMSVEQTLAANPPIYFERNLRSMVVLTREMGSRALLLTWAYSPHEYPMPGGDFMTAPFRQAAVAEHNQITRALAADMGSLHYDLAATMPEDRQYWLDGLHMSAAGTSEMARQLAEYLAAVGLH